MLGGPAEQPEEIPAVSTTLTNEARLSLQRTIDQYAESLKAGQGEAQITADLEGIEASITYKPKSWLHFGGWAGRQWGSSGWTAGVRGRASWGGK